MPIRVVDELILLAPVIVWLDVLEPRPPVYCWSREVLLAIRATNGTRARCTFLYRPHLVEMGKAGGAIVTIVRDLAPPVLLGVPI